MPYKAVVLASVFFEGESEMASRRGASRCESFTVDELIRIVQDEETGTGGLSIEEEEDLDQELYDMDEDRR